MSYLFFFFGGGGGGGAVFPINRKDSLSTFLKFSVVFGQKKYLKCSLILYLLLIAVSFFFFFRYGNPSQ